MTTMQWQHLEKLINDRANEIANSRQFFEEDPRPTEVVATLDPTTKVLRLDLDVSFGRLVGGLELEDFQSQIRVGMEDLTDQIPGFNTTDWRIGGRDMDYWFNEDFPLPERDDDLRLQLPLREPSDENPPISQLEGPNDGMYVQSTSSEAVLPRIVVAAGHGAYHHAKFGWTTQRERVNGVLEDDITQDFVDHLFRMTQLNGGDPVRVRADNAGLTHEASGLSARSVAARYYLEALEPENDAIWNSKPEDPSDLRERNQDIRSRPLYANAIGASAIAHIHTNADLPKASGTRVIVHPGRGADLAMGRLTLCSMRELIHADERYVGYTVPLDPNTVSEKGENTQAEMPSMIVEVGFHTNPNDAKLLLDPDFQRLAMRGVAKGMRLFREGASCESFRVGAQPQMTANVGQQVQMPVDLKGHPVYPVDISVKQVNCKEGQACRSERRLVASKKAADEYRFGYLCWHGEEEAPLEFVVFAKDVDGVATPSVTYTLTCKKQS